MERCCRGWTFHPMCTDNAFLVVRSCVLYSSSKHFLVLLCYLFKWYKMIVRRILWQSVFHAVVSTWFLVSTKLHGQGIFPVAALLAVGSQFTNTRGFLKRTCLSCSRIIPEKLHLSLSSPASHPRERGLECGSGLIFKVERWRMAA